jgi:hypothetical protein
LGHVDRYAYRQRRGVHGLACLAGLVLAAKGDKGDAGVAGTNGTNGVHAGVAYNFATSTAMADPSSGNVRLNNATLSSVTAIAISANSADSGNPSVSAWINTFDDSTTLGHRGLIIIRKVSAPQNFAIYDVTAALTDNATWLQLTVASVVNNGAFSAADALAISFIRTGDKGAAGAGSGDLISTNNLSDVAAKYTSFDNLSVHGADVASAGTTNLEAATGNLVDVTGTTTITAITLSEGHERVVRFTGALTLTNGASLVLPGGANITTAAGDFAIFRGYAAGVVRMVTLLRAAGRPLNSGVTDNLAAGFTTTSVNVGTKSTGTFTPDPTLGNIQHYTNGGAHTLAPPSSVCTMVVECTNASAGAITTSGFDIVDGDVYSSTGTKKHLFYITRTNSFKRLTVVYVTGT